MMSNRLRPLLWQSPEAIASAVPAGDDSRSVAPSRHRATE
jgi:hypothetical protein